MPIIFDPVDKNRGNIVRQKIIMYKDILGGGLFLFICKGIFGQNIL